MCSFVLAQLPACARIVQLSRKAALYEWVMVSWGDCIGLVVLHCTFGRPVSVRMLLVLITGVPVLLLTFDRMMARISVTLPFDTFARMFVFGVVVVRRVAFSNCMGPVLLTWRLLFPTHSTGWPVQEMGKCKLLSGWQTVWFGLAFALWRRTPEEANWFLYPFLGTVLLGDCKQECHNKAKGGARQCQCYYNLQ